MATSTSKRTAPPAPATIEAIEAAWSRGEDVDPADFVAVKAADEMRQRRAEVERERDAGQRQAELTAAIEDVRAHHGQNEARDAAEQKFRDGVRELVAQLSDELRAATEPLRVAQTRFVQAWKAAGRPPKPDDLSSVSGAWHHSDGERVAARLLAQAVERIHLDSVTDQLPAGGL